MGLPQESQTTTDGESQHAKNKPNNASQLPPEALNLASKIFDFAREGKTSEMQQYVSAGIPVNLTNHKGDTILMLAAYHGHLDTVQMLVDHGAEMDVLNDRGQSPIAGAVFKGYDEIVKFMAEKGADLAAGQPNAIDVARMFKREDCLRLFGVEGD